MGGAWVTESLLEERFPHLGMLWLNGGKLAPKKIHELLTHCQIWYWNPRLLLNTFLRTFRALSLPMWTDQTQTRSLQGERSLWPLQPGLGFHPVERNYNSREWASPWAVGMSPLLQCALPLCLSSSWAENTQWHGAALISEASCRIGLRLE